LQQSLPKNKLIKRHNKIVGSLNKRLFDDLRKANVPVLGKQSGISARKPGDRSVVKGAHPTGRRIVSLSRIRPVAI